MKKLSKSQIEALKKAHARNGYIITEKEVRHNTAWSLVKRGYFFYIGAAYRYLNDKGKSMLVYQLTLDGVLYLRTNK